MVFKVPQFIEVEDKIFGPLTFKQFLYVAGGAGACFIIWNLLPFFLAFLLIIPVGGLAIALAFYRVNNRPFVIVLEAFLQYHLGNKLYLWHKREPKKGQATSPGKKIVNEGGLMPRLSGSKLGELSWSLDVNKNIGE